MRKRTKNRKRPTARWGAAGAALLAGVCLAVQTQAARRPAGAVCFPLQTAVWRVSDGYGTRQDPFTGEERFHQGVDLACAEGTAVLAVREGVATAARRSDSYGVCLQLLHPDGTETLYAHLQYLYVRTGETVQAGQILGTAGQTGRATGAHLHFELRRFTKLHPETQSMLEDLTGEDLNGDGVVAPDVTRTDAEATAVELDHVDESATVEQEERK